MNCRLYMRFPFQTQWLFTIQARKESSMTETYCQGCVLSFSYYCNRDNYGETWVVISKEYIKHMFKGKLRSCGLG